MMASGGIAEQMADRFTAATELRCSPLRRRRPHASNRRWIDFAVAMPVFAQRVDEASGRGIVRRIGEEHACVAVGGIDAGAREQTRRRAQRENRLAMAVLIDDELRRVS